MTKNPERHLQQEPLIAARSTQLWIDQDLQRDVGCALAFSIGDDMGRRTGLRL